jgi:hypothetical protein
MLWLAGTLIAAACLVEFTAILVKIRVRQLHGQEVCREEFGRYAERLRAEPDTPDRVIKLIHLMVRYEASRRFLWSFVIGVARGKLGDQSRSTMRDIFNEMPSHSQADYIGLLISFIFGLTFNNFILGPIVRRFMLYSVPTRNNDDIGTVSPVGPIIDEFSRRGASPAH